MEQEEQEDQMKVRYVKKEIIAIRALKLIMI